MTIAGVKRWGLRADVDVVAYGGYGDGAEGSVHRYVHPELLEYLPYAGGDSLRAADVASQAVEVKVRRCGCGSWACAGCAWRLGLRLYRRLRERFAYRRVVLISLTIDRSKFKSPLEAWQFVRRNRSVSRCVMAWYEGRGWDGHGQWMAKMELQEAGWPHWHILAEVPEGAEFKRRDEMTPYWGLGFSNVRSRCRLGYVTKYACKGGDAVGTLEASGLPCRGVTWVSVSKGFWDVSEGRKERKVPCDDSFDVKRLEEMAAAEAEAKETALWVRVQCCGGHTRVTVRDAKSRYLTVKVPCAGAFVAEALGQVATECDEENGEWSIDFGSFVDSLCALPVSAADYAAVLDEVMEWIFSGDRESEESGRALDGERGEWGPGG